jgi:predicted signal transduction protein with EAL and GGDEF domain
MQAMQRVGCTHLQGYLFARALPADRIEAMVALGRLSAVRADQPVMPAEADEKVARRVIAKSGRGERFKRA